MVFVKKGAPKVVESGTRPGLSGQTLVSTGLADFDKLLGGGLPLGTVTLLLEDTYTQHHVTLLKYFIAEGAAHNHALLWAAAQSQARALPQMVNHVSKKDAKEKQQESEDVQLRIAWQYRRYIRSKQKAATASSNSSRSSAGGSKARSSSGSSAGIRDWCHSFDLTKPVPVQDLSLNKLDCPDMNGESATQSLIQSAQAFVQTLTGATDAAAQQPGNPLHPTAANQQPSATSCNPSTGLGHSVALPNSGQSRSASASDYSPVTGSSSKLPAPRAGPARPRSELHTLNPAQSEAALQRLRVSDAAKCSSEARNTPADHLHGTCEQSQGGSQPQAGRSGHSGAPAQNSEQSLASQPQAGRSGHSGAPAQNSEQSLASQSQAGRSDQSSAPAQNSSTASDQNRQACEMVPSASDDLTAGPQSRPVSGFVTSADLAHAAQLQLQQRVGRVGVQSLGGLDWGVHSYDQETERQLFTAVLQLKALMRESRCAAMVSFPAGLYSPSLATRLIHLCDTVVGLEAVRDDSDIVRLIPDAASCCGLLHLQKLPSLNALGPPLPEVTLFLIRHKRRRIAIQAVQTDPDAEAGESNSKSAAASLCGGPPKAEKAFDF